MSSWANEAVYKDRQNSLVIIVAESDTGELYQAKTMKNKTGGVQFLTKGLVKIFNSNLELRTSFTKAQRFIAPNPEAGDLDDQKVIMVSQEPTTFYCICDPKLLVEWSGEVVELAADEQRTLTGMMGKRVLLAARGFTVDGVSYGKHTVFLVESKDTIIIHNTGTDSAIFSVFYKV